MRRPGSDEWKKLISEFESGRKSQKEFAAAYDVSIHTFQFWLYKLRKQKISHSESAGRFLPVTVVGSSAPKARTGYSESLVEVAYSGLTLRFSVGTDTAYLAELIAALG